MDSTTRKLVFHKSAQFTGWACARCGWARPIPAELRSGDNLAGNIETDFANLACGEYSRKPTSKSMS
jgi:hypothetical protein